MSAGESEAEAVAGVLERLCRYCFPAGEENARGIRAVRLTERGEMRSAPNARWTEFTAEMEIDATRSNSRWDARLGGGMRWFGVTDAFEGGHGRLAIRVGGVTVKKYAGPDFDKGELQRYLASMALCPPMLLNHPSLTWTDAGNGALWLRDSVASEAAVALEIGGDGCPSGGHGLRPRAMGNASLDTPWRVAAGGFHESEGLRVPGSTEAWWDPDDGAFLYYRSEITSFMAVR
jgi:hypothetical protein